MTRTARSIAIAGLAVVLVAASGLAGCISSRSLSGSQLNDSNCPDPHRPLPFPVARPDCWSDADWGLYLDEEARRAAQGLDSYTTYQ